MRNAWTLFLLDWKRIFKSKAATLLMLALLIIPSLYCWFNVWALWDPYTNTSDLKVAVYSDDKSTSFEGKKIAIGEQLVKQLKKNDKLGWTFVSSKAQVEDGVRSGDYYAGIYVSKKFSKQLLSFVDGKMQKPHLQYYVNEKINAIAPKLTTTGASTLQATISGQFQQTVANTMMTAFNEAGVDLNDNLPMLRRFASLILDSNQKLPEMEKYIKAAQELQTQMPSIKAKIAKANAFMQYLPEANQLAQKLLKVNDYLPEVETAGQLATTLQGKIPEIKQAGSQVKTVDEDFATLAAQLTKATAAAQQGLTLVNKLDQALPAVTATAKSAQSAVATAKDDVIPRIDKALPAVQTAVSGGLATITSLNTSFAADMTKLNNYLNELEQDPNNTAAKEAAVTLLGQLASDLSEGQQTATSLAQSLSSIEAAYNKGAAAIGWPERSQLTAAAARLTNLATILQAAAPQATAAQTSLKNGNLTAAKQTISQLGSTAGKVATASTAITNAHIDTAVGKFNTQFKKLLSNSALTLSQLNSQVLPMLPSLLGNTKSLLKTTIGYMQKYEKQLPAVGQEIHDANVLLNGNMTKITKGLNLASSLYQNDYPTLKTKLGQASTFIRDDLPNLETELTTTMATINAKLPEAESALTEANQLIAKDWPLLRTGIKKGATAIKKGEKSVDFDKLIALLKRDAGKEANFLAAPVTLKTKSFYPIPTYGSASAPFYTALCMWVGGLLLSSILVTDYALSDEQKKRFGTKARFGGRFMTFAVMGLIQALIVALGNMFLLHAYVANPVSFVAASLFLDLIFMAILYSLVALFGNVGKGLGIIILVLSISGAGGNFPIQLSGAFFQMINPWLPFTYAVNLLRETVGGIYWSNMRIDILVLTAFGLVFFLLGLLLKKPIEPLMNKVHENAKISKIIH
jgi:putative membrane protein